VLLRTFCPCNSINGIGIVHILELSRQSVNKIYPDRWIHMNALGDEPGYDNAASQHHTSITCNITSVSSRVSIEKVDAGALPWTSSYGLQFSNSPPTTLLVQNSCAPRCFFDTTEDAIFTSSSGPLVYDILLFFRLFTSEIFAQIGMRCA
jgi:hypothetical protein